MFTPKWTKIKDLTKIKKHINGTSSSILANSQLSNSNCPKLLPKISLLNQVVNANNDLSKSKLIARSETNVDFDKEVDFFLGGLVTNVKQDRFKKKKKSKPAKLPNEIFDYIHITQYQKLFSLTLYNDLTYV